MKKVIFVVAVFACSISFVSCEKNDDTASLLSDKKELVDPVKPGTYHYPKMSNQWFSAGCSGTTGTCVLVVKAGLEINQGLNLQPYKGMDLQKMRESYVDNRLPNLNKYLSAGELKVFKDEMVFNDGKALISWNMELLEKGSAKDFNATLIAITAEFGGDTDNVVIVDEFGKERVIK